MSITVSKEKTMKKKLIKIVLIILILALVGGGIYMFRLGNKYKNSTLDSVRYSFGGDMMGSYQAVSLSRDGDGPAILVTEGKEHHAARMVTTTYEVPADELDKIKELMLQYDQYAGSKRRRSPIQAMDAGSGSLSFYFDDGSSFTLNSEQELNSKQSEGFRTITDYLFGLSKGKTPVSQEIEERELRMMVDGYTEIFNIRDGVTEEDLELLGGSHEVTSYGDYEKIFYPERKLDVSGLKEAVSGEAGTLAYFEPWGNVVIFTGPFEPSPGLYELGSLNYVYPSTIELLKGMEGTYDFYVYSE